MCGVFARCTHGGLWLLIGLVIVDGLIEIVEEQKCHDAEFRLTCRDLDSHIAILEAWYTAIEDTQKYYNINTTHEGLRLKTENDSELNRVFVYSSPKHNGIYEPTVSNHSFDNNLTFSNDTSVLLNDSFWFVNETIVDDMVFVNVSGVCGGTEFTRSYASWREGDRRRHSVMRNSSINLRAPLSYRCTGVNHCNFLLSEDFPMSTRWSPGVVFIKYACFDDTLSVHYCNREVRVSEWGADSEGYIRTPGYPHFYIGDECRWRLKSHPEQRVRVTLLDVSLRSIGPFEPECTDQVSVMDLNGDQLLSSCDQVDFPLRLTSLSNVVDVAVQAKSKGAYPKRGVLLHYKSVGCITLPAPSDGYLVYRNEDVAHYMCNVNYVFVDTRERARLIWCYDDNRWNDTVPFCIEELRNNFNNTSGGKEGTKMAPKDEPNMIVDIVIPSLLIAALFIGNAFIVLIIYKYRKRFVEIEPSEPTPPSPIEKNDDLEDEFNTIPLSVNGNSHTAGNAV